MRPYSYTEAPCPSNVTAVPVERTGVINVSWTAPPVESGEPIITGYTIRYRARKFQIFSCINVTTTSAEVTGLLPNTKYRVHVAPISEMGIATSCFHQGPVSVTTYKGVLLSHNIMYGYSHNYTGRPHTIIGFYMLHQYK